ncbi:MAG: D-glycero-beta-D-manno-heptose-7-phosphate kinase, partial [Acidobacteria bacterium]
MRRARIVVVGDLIADQFISGRVSRMSREAPVLILSYDSTTIVPGGAGNAAANVAALGARVDVVGLVGRDDEGRR